MNPWSLDHLAAPAANRNRSQRRFYDGKLTPGRCALLGVFAGVALTAWLASRDNTEWITASAGAMLALAGVWSY